MFNTDTYFIIGHLQVIVAVSSPMLPIGAAVTKSPMKVTSSANNANRNIVEFFLLKDIFCYMEKWKET
jgi:hypothetical protein